APHQIDPVLPFAFILQRVAPRVARIRVAGQKIHDLLRMDARGMPMSILFTPDSRDKLTDLVETAFTSPAIIAARLLAPAQLFRPALPATILMLPMRDDLGQTNRMLGAIVAQGESGHRPRRFDLAPASPIRIEPLHPIQTQSSTMPKQKPDAGRPALRLVVDNS
ncbi:MAG: PAS domain-containing protein, partial [Loktanella sp.]|nr:PAS domain-containing protein [Loktanella sp.]